MFAHEVNDIVTIEFIDEVEELDFYDDINKEDKTITGKIIAIYVNTRHSDLHLDISTAFNSNEIIIDIEYIKSVKLQSIAKSDSESTMSDVIDMSDATAERISKLDDLIKMKYTEIQECKKDNVILINENDGLKMTLKIIGKESQDYKDVTCGLNKKLADYKGRNDILEYALEERKKKAEDYKLTIEQSKKEIQEYKEENYMLKNENDRLNKTLINLSNYKQRNNVLEISLEERDKEVADYKLTVEGYKNVINSLTNEVAELQNIHPYMYLEAKIKKYEKEIQTYADTINSLTDIIDRVRNI